MSMFLSFLFSVLNVCLETLRNVADSRVFFKRGLSSSHAIYTVNSVVNEYCGILSDGILSGSRDCCGCNL